MSRKSNLVKALGLGAAATVMTAGAALAANATTPVNVRTGPSTRYAIVDTLYAGEHVNVVGRSGGWCRVTKSGPDGWVACAYLTNGAYRPAPPPAPRIGFSFGFGYPGFGHFPYPGHRDHDHDHDHDHDYR